MRSTYCVDLSLLINTKIKTITLQQVFHVTKDYLMELRNEEY